MRQIVGQPASRHAATRIRIHHGRRPAFGLSVQRSPVAQIANGKLRVLARRAGRAADAAAELETAAVAGEDQMVDRVDLAPILGVVVGAAAAAGKFRRFME
jgi:hypothetical protein